MTTNKGLRVFAVAALGLGLISVNAFAALPADKPTFTHTQFQIRGRVEDSISVTGLSDVEIDFDNMKSHSGGWVASNQKFTVERNGATADAPGLFSITAKSQYGAAGNTPDLEEYHVTKNQRGDMLPVALSYWSDLIVKGEKLIHAQPVINRQTSGKPNEHTLGVAFHKDDLENANPGLYNTNVTLYITAE